MTIEHDGHPAPASPAHGGVHGHHGTAAPTTAATAHADSAAHVGHDKHAGHSVEMFRRKFWGTLVLSIPALVWGPIQHWFGYEAWGGPAATRWIPAVFGTLVFVYGGWVFIRGAIGELAARLPGMMTLIALAISVAVESDSEHTIARGIVRSAQERGLRIPRAVHGRGRCQPLRRRGRHLTNPVVCCPRSIRNSQRTSVYFGAGTFGTVLLLGSRENLGYGVTSSAGAADGLRGRRAAILDPPRTPKLPSIGKTDRSGAEASSR